jgi:hypothetical protein
LPLLQRAFIGINNYEMAYIKNLNDICKSENQNIEYVKQAIRQRFLAPQIIKNITLFERSHNKNPNSNHSQIGVEELKYILS